VHLWAGLAGQLPEPDVYKPVAKLHSYRWQKHCRGLFHTPIARLIRNPPWTGRPGPPGVRIFCSGLFDMLETNRILEGAPSMITHRNTPRILAPLVLTVCCLALVGAKLNAAEPADDRQTALWVIQEGGKVLLENQGDYIDDPFEIPDSPVYVVGVNMHGTVTEAKDYEPLSRLSKLREIFIPARLWSPTFDTKGAFSDEMFGYFARSKTLEKLHAGLTSLAYLRIGEEGVARLRSARERLAAAELKVQAVLEEAGGDIRLTDLDA